MTPLIDSGNLKIRSWMPESRGSEEHLIQLLQDLAEFHADFLILDAISALQRMASRETAFDYLMRLVDFCKHRGILALFTNQIPLNGAREAPELTGLGFSSLIDTVILLQFREERMEMFRYLLALKSRGARPSTRFHSFRITDEGMVFPEKAPKGRLGSGGIAKETEKSPGSSSGGDGPKRGGAL